MKLGVRLVVPELPCLAERRPHRAVLLGDVDGTCQVVAADTRTGASHAVTGRPQGTFEGAIDPAGERVWWFDDDSGGTGVWRAQPFTGGPDRDELAGVPAGKPGGLAMARDGTVAVGVGTGDDLTVYLRRPGRPAHQVLRTRGNAHLVDLSADGDLLAVGAEPDAPDAVRILRPDGTTVAVVPGRSGQVRGLAFRRTPGRPAFLFVVEARTGYRPALWTPDGRLSTVDHRDFDTEITASWFPDGRRLLVRQHRHARSRLFEVDLERRSCRPIPTPPGSILDAAVQPDGVLRYVWTRGGQIPEIRTGPPPLPAPTEWAHRRILSALVRRPRLDRTRR